MNFIPPSFNIFVLFGVLYLVQSVRFVQLVSQKENAIARPVFKFWKFASILPVILMTFNPSALPAIAPLIVWVRENIVYLLGSAVAIAEVLIRYYKQLFVKQLQKIPERSEDPEMLKAKVHKYINHNPFVWVLAIVAVIFAMWVYTGPMIDDLPYIIEMPLFIIPFYAAGQVFGWLTWLQIRWIRARTATDRSEAIRTFWKYNFTLIGYWGFGLFMSMVLQAVLSNIGGLLGTLITAWSIRQPMLQSAERLLLTASQENKSE